jgi:hypothetical protein
VTKKGQKLSEVDQTMLVDELQKALV